MIETRCGMLSLQSLLSRLTARRARPLLLLLAGLPCLQVLNGRTLAHHAPTPQPTVLQTPGNLTVVNDAFTIQAVENDVRPDSASADPLRKSASWQWPDASNYQELISSYLEQLASTDETRSKLEQFWLETAENQNGPVFLDRLLNAAAILEPRIEALNAELRSISGEVVRPGELQWLTSDVPGWLQDTVRLACGRAMAQRRLYDESLEILGGLQLDQVCDPATLLFYRATCQHNLLQKDACLTNAQVLLERDDEIPARFAQIAKLMVADIKPLEQDSLDEIARKMFDVQRRLDLGRAGKRVRDEEDEIVEKLDKLIEQIENQMQQQQQQQQQQSQGSQSQSQQKPMDSSQIAGGGGPGDVENKDAGDRAGWGNLPPAERQQALQRLTEELPSHYREVIEGYFRQLAKEKK